MSRHSPSGLPFVCTVALCCPIIKHYSTPSGVCGCVNTPNWLDRAANPCRGVAAALFLSALDRPVEPRSLSLSWERCHAHSGGARSRWMAARMTHSSGWLLRISLGIELPPEVVDRQLPAPPSSANLRLTEAFWGKKGSSRAATTKARAASEQLTEIECSKSQARKYTAVLRWWNSSSEAGPTYNILYNTGYNMALMT
ncbi:hypothetical protein SAMN05444414_102192 [Roseovarius marisflavi]|uniref:Uncharacterized protein n=1 Tax=Roseovarius marisflavi TaxID=1054996 RepID=A0A1M6W9A6_9RHOB|nr:hypothetical protein SAMN05444414_102192 [Roseovarius marisflavi]